MGSTAMKDFSLNRGDGPPVKRWFFSAGAVVVGLILLLTVMGSWYTVDQGERAVVLRLGAIVGEAGPGLHFKMPWINTVHKITVQNQNRRYTPLEAYSRDQQPANLTRQRDVHGVRSDGGLQPVRRSRRSGSPAHRSEGHVGREDDLRPVRCGARDSRTRRSEQ